jgi:Family of unknown function (DUF6065)/Sulfotransferase domain
MTHRRHVCSLDNQKKLAYNFTIRACAEANGRRDVVNETFRQDQPARWPRSIRMAALNGQASIMNLTCYRIVPHAPDLAPGRAERAWMDATRQHGPYRCTPLTMANSTGWEIPCPVGLTAQWDGSPRREDLVVAFDDAALAGKSPFARSHFGFGVITFLPGYLFRTDPGWALWCRGAPNHPKDGIVALDGLVETDWMPFTMTMNWLFTRPGTVRFEKGEPFCFILPIPHMQLETVEPRILPLAANPELAAEHAAWGASRAEFNQGLATRDPATLKEKWQRFYLNGKSPGGLTAPDTHRVKRKMKPAVAVSATASAAPPPAAPRAEPIQQNNVAPAPQPAALQAQPTQQDTVVPSPHPPARAAAELAPAGAVAQNIIWLASYPKSGNTWVRALLYNLGRELRGDADGSADINRLNEFTGWDTRTAPYARLLGKPVSEASHREIAQIRPRVQADLANSRPQPFLVKTHQCLGNDWQSPTINLNATLAAIYIVRNPLDVAISYAHHSAIRIDAMIANMATAALMSPTTTRHVYEVLGSWSEHVASWLGLNNRPLLILRYEDLSTNPLRPLTTLARFLGLAPTEDQLKAAIAKSSFAEMRRQEAENGFNERPSTAKVFFREGRAGQWRDVLSQAQVTEIVRAHEPLMQRLGYLPPSAGAGGRFGLETATRPRPVGRAAAAPAVAEAL